jgi:Asp-tRNA(Asn)/Glu-tRNA(Gln) amidotransferase A subunit family amidase
MSTKEAAVSPAAGGANAEAEAADSAQIAAAVALTGLEFTDEEIQLMTKSVGENRAKYAALRSVELANHMPPALRFDAKPQPDVVSGEIDRQITVSDVPADLTAPANLEDVAFWPVSHLAHLLRTRQVTSTQLTQMYLSRLKRYDPYLRCVVSLTEERAMRQAAQADAEIAAGKYRGPLHGVPWGAKDLLATKGYRTTWGAPPYKDQVIDLDATVVQRLDEAGAVLVAKLTMGSLAWGDVWFDGVTKSPWNREEGSSGSSAGSGSATAAGLVGFAIGTETHGSIVSPSTQCGLSGLRPTFGRVSRYGAMTLCWTLDKIGPMCRSVEDCALVFSAIHGPDGKDPTVEARPFHWPPDIDLSKLRIGYVAKDFELDYYAKEQDRQSIDVLRSLGANLVPIDLPDLPLEAMQIILYAEAAAAFDDLTRSNRDDLLVRQGENGWPNKFRTARLIPAVEYIQANRIRLLAMQQMDVLMQEIDVYVAPSLAGRNLWLTNATGHPTVVVHNGFRPNNMPTTISFTGRLFDEATLLAVAKAYQDATDWHLQHPAMPE